MRAFALLLVIVTSNIYAQAIEWVTIGDPFNDPNPSINLPSSGCCTLFYSFDITRYEITNTQYAEMLNAVAASDPNELWVFAMGANSAGGITRTGSDGSYVYQVKSGFANVAVNFVSFNDGMRFANWLHNGKPVGAQDSNTTEDGAYTLTATGLANNTIVRNPDAEYYLPNLEEWRKAAYFDSNTNTWFEYPAGSNIIMTGSIPGVDAGNNGHCGSTPNTPVDVGSYPLSSSPYGTFDQGGNVQEYTETIAGFTRVTAGGSYGNACAGTSIDSTITRGPTQQGANYGFRIARPGPAIEIPVPLIALALLAAMLVGVAARISRLK